MSSVTKTRMKIDNAKDMMGSTRAALQIAEGKGRRVMHEVLLSTLKRKVVNRIRVLLRLAVSMLPYSLHDHVRDSSTIY